MTNTEKLERVAAIEARSDELMPMVEKPSYFPQAEADAARAELKELLKEHEALVNSLTYGG